MKVRVILLLGAVAVLSSLLRFGQRENEISVLSDSDYYLDMAKVFWGGKSSFNREYCFNGPHHYNRPLLPFLAGGLGCHALHGNTRAAFSIVNILMAWLIASLLYKAVLDSSPGGAYAWLPSICFLTAFPQMNWGYHILTETTGIALAFAASYWLSRVLSRMEGNAGRVTDWNWHRDRQFLMGSAVFLLLQTVAFLARETAWLSVFVLIFVAGNRRLYRGKFLIPTLVCLDLVFISWIPQVLYAAHWETGTAPLLLHARDLLNPKYIGDFVVKSGLAFHVAWLPALFVLWRDRGRGIPVWIGGWCVGVLAYMAAGYCANTVDSVGYPMRLTFALAPGVYWLVLDYFRSLPSGRGTTVRLAGLLGASVVISVAGVLLDSGVIHRIYDVRLLFQQ